MDKFVAATDKPISQESIHHDFNSNLQYPQTVQVLKHEEPTLFDNENLYARVLNSNQTAFQYITSTHALAPILSKDSMLCLDGEVLGLYCPYRDLNYSTQSRNNMNIDKILREYLDKKKAFALPPKQEQTRLLNLFYEHVYPIYPVIERNLTIDDDIPLILLNSIMLASVRYDKQCGDHRVRASKFKQKCELLELCENNKITLIQSYLLISIDEEGESGALVAKDYISKAVILSTQVGLQNLAETDLEIDNISPNNSENRGFKLRFDKNLLQRIFWSTFCCDRYICSTSSTTMIYDRGDMLVDEPSLNDFPQGDHQMTDFQIFNKWYQLCCFVERVLKAAYRPPGKRIIDEELENDLVNWETQLEGVDIPPAFYKFFQVFHCHCALLYLRCKIGVLNLIETEYYNSQETSLSQLDIDTNTPLSTYATKFIQIYCSRVIDVLSPDNVDIFQHVVSIHGLLHGMVLIHLEIEVKGQTSSSLPGTNDDIYKCLQLKRQQLAMGQKILQKLQPQWWFSGASYHLFQYINKINK